MPAFSLPVMLWLRFSTSWLLPVVRLLRVAFAALERTMGAAARVWRGPLVPGSFRRVLLPGATSHRCPLLGWGCMPCLLA